MDVVHFASMKWPDRPHWRFSMRRLGRDQHGVWLLAPAGTVARRGDEPPRTMRTGFVMLAPERDWWTIEFYRDHPSHSIYVNVGTPCEWDGDRLGQVDLDLDVVLTNDGAVEVLDEDEFADHRVRFDYPQALVDGAEAATRTAVDLLATRREPFDAAVERWWGVAG